MATLYVVEWKTFWTCTLKAMIHSAIANRAEEFEAEQMVATLQA